MSESNDRPSNELNRSTNGTTPRATIHKQILDVAEAQPDVPIEAIAEAVSGATPELVERVFDEYGDPGDPDEESATAEATEPSADLTLHDLPLEAMSDEHDDPEPEDRSDDSTEAETTGSTFEMTVPGPETLTETQLETLRAIHDRPTATQAELAAEFDITAASIGQRVNSIEGFDWSERRAFTEALFGSPAGTGGTETGSDDGTGSDATAGDTPAETSDADGGSEDGDADGSAEERDAGGNAEERDANGGAGDSADGRSAVDVHADQLETIAERLDRLDRRIAEQSGGRIDPDLVHKVAHACVESEQISEEEELRILRTLMGAADD